MPGFAEVVASGREVEGSLRLIVPPEWHQGRTAYGGFSSALCLHVAMRTAEDLPPLRSAQLSMVGPVAGDVAVAARIVRRGRNATWVTAQIFGSAGPCFLASFVFMGPVDNSALHLNDRSPPAGLIPVDQAEPFHGRNLSAFSRENFDIRFALPRAEEKRPELCWWARLRDRTALDPMVEVLLVGDALPPGVMPLLTASINGSTMQWQANVLTPAPATDDGWWLLRSVGDYAERGCSGQRMGMWNAQGAPALAGLQSVAIFG